MEPADPRLGAAFALRHRRRAELQVEIGTVTRNTCCLFAVQVDLGRLTFLTVVGTQGRYVRNSGNEFARAYRLNYSRDGQLWKSWRNRLGNTVSWPEVFSQRRRTRWVSGGGRRGGKWARKTVNLQRKQSDGRKGQAKERKLCCFLFFFLFNSLLPLVSDNRKTGNDIYTPASCCPPPHCSPIGHNLKLQVMFSSESIRPNSSFSSHSNLYLFFFFLTLRYYSRKQTARRDWFVQLEA